MLLDRLFARNCTEYSHAHTHTVCVWGWNGVNMYTMRIAELRTITMEQATTIRAGNSSSYQTPIYYYMLISRNFDITPLEMNTLHSNWLRSTMARGLPSPATKLCLDPSGSHSSGYFSFLRGRNRKSSCEFASFRLNLNNLRRITRNKSNASRGTKSSTFMNKLRLKSTWIVRGATDTLTACDRSHAVKISRISAHCTREHIEPN